MGDGFINIYDCIVKCIVARQKNKEKGGNPLSLNSPEKVN